MLLNAPSLVSLPALFFGFAGKLRTTLAGTKSHVVLCLSQETVKLMQLFVSYVLSQRRTVTDCRWLLQTRASGAEAVTVVIHAATFVATLDIVFRKPFVKC